MLSAVDEVAAGNSEFALGTAKLLEQQIGQTAVGCGDADGVLQAFVVRKYESLLFRRKNDPYGWRGGKRQQVINGDCPNSRSVNRPTRYPDGGARVSGLGTRVPARDAVRVFRST